LQLQKGQRIKLEDIVENNNFKIQVTLQSKGVEDVTCFGVDENNKLSDDRYFVFYNQLSSPKNEITMNNSGNVTCFNIQLNNLPESIKKLVITIASENGIMKDIVSGSMKLISNNEVKAEFLFNGNDFQNEKAIILSEIYQKNKIWRISSVADGFNGGLSALLKFFGGEEVKPTSQPKQYKEETKSPKVISLKKKGDTHKISLSKNSGTIHVNLNWSKNSKKGFFGTSKAIDLDLACMYRLKSGEKGVIQALGNSFGSKDKPPYIKLDKDDRTGESNDGENMFFTKPESIDFAIVFAFIYEGIPNWSDTNAVVTLQQSGSPDIEIKIDNSNVREILCVIASMSNDNGNLEIKKEEKFFNGHEQADKYYGFGFRWVAGRK